MDWQEGASPYIEYAPEMENAWGYLESRGWKLKFEHPFLDGANEKRKREAKAEPLAQPAGGLLQVRPNRLRPRVPLGRRS
eukprot:967011-Pyramimonas_sp.AAC.1